MDVLFALERSPNQIKEGSDACEARREFLETSNEREEGRKGERERRREMKCFRAS